MLAPKATAEATAAAAEEVTEAIVLVGGAATGAAAGGELAGGDAVKARAAAARKGSSVHGKRAQGGERRVWWGQTRAWRMQGCSLWKAPSVQGPDAARTHAR